MVARMLVLRSRRACRRSLLVQRHRRAYVPRHAVETRAQFNLSRPFCFHDQKFLAVQPSRCVRPIQNDRAQNNAERGLNSYCEWGNLPA